jgi:FkbM family methyltransferase
LTIASSKTIIEPLGDSLGLEQAMLRTVLRGSREVLPFLRQPEIRQETTSVSLTVFDVGMNNGDDSAHYLSKGFKVIAVEANPILVQRARLRFQAEITSGQMVIEPFGIRDHPGRAPFWINEERDVFSSFDRMRASRGGTHCRSVDVECVTFDTLLKKYGVPYYLKLDVEGAEPHCLTSLRSTGLPRYISVEAESLEYLLLLWQLGYRQFKVVDQMRHNSRFPDFTNDNAFSRLAKRMCSYADRFKNRAIRIPFPRGCSGPFGEDTSGSWQPLEEVAYNWLHLHFGHHDRGNLSAGSWYDFHAKASYASIDTRRFTDLGNEMYYLTSSVGRQS